MHGQQNIKLSRKGTSDTYVFNLSLSEDAGKTSFRNL